MEVPPPERYLVEDTISMSTPNALICNSVKGMAVESAMRGMPAAWAVAASACKSATFW